MPTASDSRAWWIVEGPRIFAALADHPEPLFAVAEAPEGRVAIRINVAVVREVAQQLVGGLVELARPWNCFGGVPPLDVVCLTRIVSFFVFDCNDGDLFFVCLRLNQM